MLHWNRFHRSIFTIFFMNVYCNLLKYQRTEEFFYALFMPKDRTNCYNNTRISKSFQSDKSTRYREAVNIKT